ncbi:MAG: sensor histidine kinase [Streptomyces sp.]|nr:sensor histidine kinase [Streptomyces sp.]
MTDVNLLPATDDIPMTRPRRQGYLRAMGVTTLVLLAAADVLIAASNGKTLWPVLLLLSLGLAAVLWPSWPSARRPAWLTPQLRAAVPAGASLALTAVAATTERVRTLGPGEVAVLLCLLLIAVRTCSPRWALLCAVLTGGATVVMPLRFYDIIAREDALLFTLPLALLTGVFAGLGGYLRSLDRRRGVAVAETRRSERLAMAADLHDFVAHHVTGILVQTQMARMMVSGERDRLDPVLAGIEHAATQALDSMRVTVGILRGGPQETARVEPGENRPVGDLMALAELVDGFGGPTGLKAELHCDASVPRNLPHEVQAAAYRVVQEALTNVRRHAADATEVTVALAHADDTLRVTVRDNGRGGAPLPYAARGGGFGIVGLTERVIALGGTLHTGPRGDHGWEVVALLPAVSRAD